MIRRIVPSLLAAMTVASPAMADPLPGWAAALASGEDRLAIHALGRARPAGSGVALARFAARQGGAHPPGAGLMLIDRQAQAWPILSWSQNFNGGIPADSIRIGPFDFQIAEADRARSGIVIGAGAGASARFSYATGSVLRVSAQVATSVLAGEGLSRSEVGTAICAQHFAGGWAWIDACAGVSATRASGQNDLVQRNYSIGPVMVGAPFGLDQQLALSLRHRDRSDFSQSALAMDWTGAVPDLGALSIGAEIGRRVEGQNVPLRGLSLGLARPVMGRPAWVRIDWQRIEGGQFLGQPRQDRVVNVTADMQVTPRVAVQASIGRRDSNINIYDEPLGALTLRLSPRR